MDHIRQTNQSLSSSAVAVAKQNPKKLGWKGDTWGDRGTEKEEKETAGHRQPAKKKERSPATNATFFQVRQSDASGNPSFLPGLEEALLTHFLSLVYLWLLSPQALQNPGIKKRRLSPLFSSSLPSARLFPDAKQQRGAVFLEAGVKAYAEQQQIWPGPSYHCNYAFHCPNTKDDRMCGIRTMFHNVSASFCINSLRERLVQQGNARLVPHMMDSIWSDTGRAVISWHTKA